MSMCRRTYLLQMAQAEQNQIYSLGYGLANSLIIDRLNQENRALFEHLRQADCWVVEMGTGDVKLHFMLEAMQVESSPKTTPLMTVLTPLLLLRFLIRPSPLTSCRWPRFTPLTPCF
jgi:hypothetical protein